MNKLSGFIVLLLFFCFSSSAFAQTQGKGLIYLDVGEESFGGLYYPASKGDTKSHIWYSHEKILSALYGAKSQFYTAFDTVWPAATGTPYPGDRYLPVGKWFIPLLHQKQSESSCTAAKIETFLETSVGEINNNFSLGLKTLRLDNNLTVKAIMTGILTLKEENTTQGESIDGLLLSVDSLSDRVESLGKSLDEKFRQLKKGSDSILKANLASRQQGVESKLQEIIDAQEALIAQLQKRDQRLWLQIKKTDNKLAFMEEHQGFSRQIEMAAVILLIVLIWLVFFLIIFRYKHQRCKH